MTDVGVPNSEDTLTLPDALELMRPAMQALADSELLPINLDPLAVVTTVRGALPKLVQLKPRLAAAFIGFDLSNLDALYLRALALMQAHFTYLSTSAPPKRLNMLLEQASATRRLFLSDVTALIARGLLPESCLNGLRRRKGHHNVAHDLLTLATILRTHWPRVAGATAVTEAELEIAADVGNELVGLLGARRNKPEALARAERERQQAYTLLVNAYAEVRDAVQFIGRRDPSVRAVAPSLYRKRKGRKLRALRQDSASNDAPSERADSVRAQPQYCSGKATGQSHNLRPCVPALAADPERSESEVEAHTYSAGVAR